MRFDTVIRNGTLVTASDTFESDIGITEGRIVAMAERLSGGDETIDATGRLVLPGGVDAHCHIDEPSYLNARLADDFASATRAAACGGTTTIIPFANQLPERSLREAVVDYHRRVDGQACIDYAFHMIVNRPTDAVLGQELPALIRDGYSSLKVFMTYDGYHLDDEAILDVMDVSARHGGVVMVHAENGHCVRWLAARLEGAGETGLHAHGRSAPAVVEREATHRALALGEITGAPVMIVHVSSGDAMDEIGRARRRGQMAYGETCPQYLMLRDEDFAQDGWEGAKYLCAPPPRDAANAERLWRGLDNGDLQILSSDHCPYRFEGNDGKRSGGRLHFRHVPPGLPGIETRLILLFHAGVSADRISLHQFVEMTATEPARIYGLYPKKGTLAIGSDADIVLWDPAAPMTIRHADLHDACDYTPYEGYEGLGRPVVTLSRGQRIWDSGRFAGEPGRGRFVAQKPRTT